MFLEESEGSLNSVVVAFVHAVCSLQEVTAFSFSFFCFFITVLITLAGPFYVGGWLVFLCLNYYVTGGNLVAF